MISVLVLSIGLIATPDQDRRMPDAIRQRLELAKIVAEAKHLSGAPVEDRVRERQVILVTVRQGVRLNVNPDVVLKVFRA